jgi:hypothetical protein
MVKQSVEELRRDIEEIIAVKPAMISLVRLVEETDEDDNTNTSRITLDEQRFRIAEISNNESERLMEQGLIPSHVVNITAPWNADIRKGDRFEYKGERFEIQFIRPYEFFGDGEDYRYKWSGKAKEINEAIV